MSRNDLLPISNSYFLGIDGGGSKTLAVLVDAQGQEVGRGLSGSANYATIGLQPALSNIYEAVSSALSAKGITLPVEKAWLGLAGIDREEDRLKLLPHFQQLAAHVRLTNDAELALGELDNAVGIALIAGTGSIALGRNAEGEEARCGGWGHLLGDEGSGYDLGHQALLAAVRSADGRGPRTALLELILRFWSLPNAEALIEKVYSDQRKDTIAALSPCVMQAYEQSDELAQQIVEQSAAELALLVTTLSSRLGMTHTLLPLAFCGGLLLNEPLYSELVLLNIRCQQVIESPRLVEQPALSAARELAKEGKKEHA